MTPSASSQTARRSKGRGDAENNLVILKILPTSLVSSIVRAASRGTSDGGGLSGDWPSRRQIAERAALRHTEEDRKDQQEPLAPERSA
jgi:hypothetical protein